MTSLTVDLADPSSIKAKLPEAEEALEVMKEELEKQRQEVERWQGLVAVMKALTSGANADDAPQLSEMQSLVVGVVNREIRKIRAKEVTEILQSEGHDISGDSVSNALWYAAEKVEPQPIQRVGRGFYAPLAYQEVEIGAAGAAASVAAGAGLGAIAAHTAQTILKGAAGS